MKAALPLIASFMLLAGCATRPAADDAFQSAAHSRMRGFERVSSLTPHPAESRAVDWIPDRDPELDQLIAQALVDNLDLRELFARRQAARADLREARAGLWPLARLSARSQRSKIPKRDEQLRDVGDVGAELVTLENPATRHAFGIEASYEIDLWGRVRASVSAAAAELNASEHDLQAASISIAADVAHEYFSVRSADRVLMLQKERADLLGDLVRRERMRLSAGVTDATALLRAERDLLVLQHDRASLAQEREAAEHRLALLLGASPADFTLAPREEWAAPSAKPPAYLSATVLESRPDIAAAQARLYAADARLGEARAARLPALMLTGIAGYASDALHRLLRQNAFEWAIGSTMQVPLFDGRVRARAESAAAEAARLRAAYQSTSLRALAEVENALSAFAAARAREEAASASKGSLDQSITLLSAQVAAGRSSRLPLIASQVEALLAQETIHEAERDRIAATVALLRALGVPWKS